MHGFVRFAMLGAAAALLGGCGLFPGSRQAANAPAAPAALHETPREQSLRQLLAFGREHLEAGRNASAVEMYGAALAMGEAPAEAFNGLGVAFARLGRFDLAERNFQRAAALAPNDARYHDNLVLLMRSPRYAAMRQAQQLAALQGTAQAAPAAFVADAERAATGAAAGRTGQIVRIDRGQVFIAAAPPQAAPPQAAPRSAVTVAMAAKRAARPRAAALSAPDSASPAAAPAERAGVEAEAGQPRTIEFTPAAASASEAAPAAPH